MRVAMFGTKPYGRHSFDARNALFGQELHYLEPRLEPEAMASSPAGSATRIGYLVIDVYWQGADLFLQNLSNEIVQDDAFQRLLTFPKGANPW